MRKKEASIENIGKWLLKYDLMGQKHYLRGYKG